MSKELTQHIQKDNLHHAYLIEGKEVSDVLGLLETLGIEIEQNPDVNKISLDVFKIEDARNLNSSAMLKAFSNNKKIFIVFAEEFPTHYKKVALTCLFAPSFVFWSTNILKDPLCIFGLGLCFSALYSFMKRRFKFLVLIELIIGSLLMLSFKSYIFYIFCVAAFYSLYINFITNFITNSATNSV